MNRRAKSSLVTMEDVAQAAGVSRMTVSRALRSEESVSKQTREKILSIVSEMNYVPDQMAGSLSSKRSGFVGALVPSLNNLHYADMVQTLTQTIGSTGLQILLGHTDYSMAREEELVEGMLKRRPEAIALPYDGHTKRTIQLLKQAQIPIIELWEIPSKPIAYTVGYSNEQASYDMTKKLIQLGCEKIAFLCETNDEWTRGASRRAGFKKAMEEAGLSAHRMIRFGSPPMSIKDGYFVGSNLNQYYDDVDCVFCVSDSPAFGVITALREKGINVPADISVAGFGDFEVGKYSNPSISTVSIDSTAVGRITSELVLQLLDQDKESNRLKKKHVIKTELIMRDSTRPE